MRPIPTTSKIALRRLVLTMGVYAACVAVAPAAGAQTTAGSPRTSTAQALPPIVITASASASAPLARGPFAFDDALLAGISLSDVQKIDIVELRQMQIEEQESARPQFLDAVAAMRRAHGRGDDDGAGAIMALLQGEMQQRRTWRLVALRALLAPDQRRAFDANLDALLSDEADASRGDGQPE